MKKFKKLSSLLAMAGILTTMMVSPVSAETISNGKVKPNSTIQGTINISGIKLDDAEIILPDGAKLTRISKDQYVSTLAKEKNISISKAYEMDAENSQKTLTTAPLSAYAASAYTTATIGDTYYYNYSSIYSYNGNYSFKAELDATLKIYSYGSFRQIDNVMAVSSRRYAGLYTYSWSQMSAWSDPTAGSSSFPTTSVTIGASGYFEVLSTYSIDVSKDLLGFTLGGSVGGEYRYQSNTMYMVGSYSLGY